MLEMEVTAAMTAEPGRGPPDRHLAWKPDAQAATAFNSATEAWLRVVNSS